MESRNWIGLVIILAGVILQPIGWMYFYWVQIVSYALIFIGVFIFATQSYLDKSVEKEYGTANGSAMPGDVLDHSGWGKGGRSESWNSDFGGSDFGGDGGGSGD